MAAYYWVGGTGTWDASTTTNWSLTSGGAGGAGVPGAADTAQFDVNSGTTPVITTSGSLSIASLQLLSGFTGTVTFAGTMTVSGNVGLSTGTLNTNGQTCNWGSFSSSNSSARTLTMGASAITITQASTAVWNVVTVTNMTITANTAVITMTGTSANFRGGNVNWNGTSLIFNGGGSTGGLPDNPGTFANVTFTGGVSTANSFLVNSTSTLTVTGTLTVNGNSNQTRVLIQGNVAGTAANISAAAVSMSYVDIEDITASGAASWNLSAITGLSGDCGGNTGITFTTAVPQFWVGGTGNWTTTSTNWATSSGGTAGSGRVPLPQDNVTFDANSFTAASQTVTLNGGAGRIGKSISWTGVTHVPTFSYSIAIANYGSLTWVSTALMTITGTHTWNFNGRGATYTLTNAGQTGWCLNCVVTAPTATYVLADALTIASTGALDIFAGTLDNSINNASITTPSLQSTGTLTRAFKMGTGTITIANSSGVWQTASTGLTLTPSTCVVTFTNTTTITTGGVSMPSINVNGASAVVTLQDSYTCASTLLVSLTQGTLNTNSQTCSWGTFTCSGASAKTLTLGTSAINISGNVSGEGWQWSGTNTTITANTAVVTFSAIVTTNMGTNINYNGMSVVMTAAAGNGYSISTAGHTIANFTYAPAATSTANVLTIYNNFTVTGSVTFTGAASPNVPVVISGTLGTAHTITCNGTATLTGRMDFQDLTGAGTATWNFATNGGDCGGNSGITFATPQTNYWVGNTGSWSTTTAWASTSGGTASTGRVPYPQDNVTFDANSFTSTGRVVTGNAVRLGASVNWTGATNTPQFTDSVGWTMYGSLTLISAMTFSVPVSPVTFAGRGTFTISTAGKTFSSFSITAPGGTYTQQDAMNCIGVFSHYAGTYSTNNLALTILDYSVSNNSVTKNLSLGSSTVTVTGAGVSWSAGSAGYSISPGTSTIIFTATANATTFGGGNLTYSTVQFPSGGTYTITGSNTFTKLIVSPQTQLIFTSGTTQTITTASGWQVSGTDYGYQVMPGTAANTTYISTPDSPALDITGDIDIRAQASLVNWTSITANGGFVAKWNSNTTKNYILGLTTTGTILLDISVDGTTTLSSASSTAVGFAAGATGWVRATRVASTGVVTFYTSTDGVNWTQLGTTVTLAAGSPIFSSNVPVEICTSNLGTANQLPCKIYRAQIYNGINGTLVFDANFTTKSVGANTFTESSTNGATVTITGAIGQAGDGRVPITASTQGSAATISIASGSVSSSYVTLQDNTAAGGAIPFTAINSVIGSNVTNWQALSVGGLLTFF